MTILGPLQVEVCWDQKSLYDWDDFWAEVVWSQQSSACPCHTHFGFVLEATLEMRTFGQICSKQM